MHKSLLIGVCGVVLAQGQVQTAKLVGQVRDERLKPIAGARVDISLRPARGVKAKPFQAAMLTRADGTFQVSVSAGTYSVCASIPNGDLLDSCLWSDPVLPSVRTGETVRLSPITLRRGYPVTLLSKTGQAALQACPVLDSSDRKWGYQSCVSWSDDGMLSLGSADYRPLDFLHVQEGHEFLPYEGIYAAALFGGLMIRMGTITGARGGEIQQIAQSPECFKQLDNVGPKAATRWVLRMIPKGRKDRADYYIDEDTKNHLVELIRFQCERLGKTLLPVVKPEYGKTPPDRYVLQWNGHGIDLQVLNTLIRFLLHGVLFQAMDGSVVQLTSHLLRHAFANEMAELKVSVDIIASLLHQRDRTVTKYYSRPTPTQVIRAAEMIFVDRIDVGAEALRSPDEIGRMLKDAEGKLGALTEVFGGTCVVANMCPAKFACVGCAGNAPDPAKRHQIQQRLEWAKEQVSYAVREHLPAEEVKLGQLIADCKLVMEEMDLIESARADRSQDLTVQHGHSSK